MDFTETYGNTWKETGLGDAQKDTGGEETVVVSYDAHESHDRAPGNHDGGKPDAGAEFLEQQVGRHLERRICEEEDSQTPVVLVG